MIGRKEEESNATMAMYFFLFTKKEIQIQMKSSAEYVRDTLHERFFKG